MRVSVIVVSYKRKDLLDKCLESLRAQTFKDFEVIVVDNSINNVGFAAGVNQGIKRAKGEFIALLNDDATALEDWLSELMKAALYSGAGMCASRVLRPDGTIDSAGCMVGRDGNGECRGRGSDGYRHPDYVDFPSGCAALYKKSMLDAIGLFDERFFMYNEDTELGIRAQKAGYKCLYVPTAGVTHLYSQSSSPYSLKKLFYVERNRILIMIRYFTSWQMVKSVMWTVSRYVKLSGDILARNYFYALMVLIVVSIINILSR